MLQTLLFKNYIMFSTIISYILAQVIKTILYTLMNKKFDYKRLFGSGGMPSSHSASVVSLATASFLKYGALSPFTAITIVLRL